MGCGYQKEQEVREGNAFQQLFSESSDWRRTQGDCRPDDFTVAFWQSCWDFLKEEILDMFKEFHEQNSFLKSLNNTFLVLLLKRGGLRTLGIIDPSACIRRGRRQAVNISHLLFADDTIIFCEAKKEHLTHLSWILFWFEVASGLRINLAKSEIILIGEVEEVDEMAVELGCRVGQLLAVYLGLPLGAPNKASSVWDGVEERVRRRLVLWKRQYISKGGRITLIKTTMASMPLYQMSLFRMPKTVARRLEKLHRDFLWGRGNLEKKAHLVNWEVVCADKENGGLGLRKLALLNKALLGKWIWRFACVEEDLWKQVLVAKYGQENLVGKAPKIIFWTDLWCGCTMLSQRFPHLYAMAVHKNATVEKMITLEEDSVFWKEGRNGQFRVKKAYNLLVNPMAAIFPKSNIWVDRVPTKIAFFAWKAAWGKMLALDRLQKRGWQLPNCCFLCGCKEETVNHILIHCTVARVLWDIVLGLFGA
ncbi:putative ribonuclease H protein [Vitis vinifera]|uniref:Putative ribonuclease H protein n=1 Tax=Vitis vinifera TaxID=29760 RepID=A0A438JPR1_VITVI|nr:putative ribonuclease H protein [Vitis vinifera]